ncbi:MAG: hypothetical protein QM535_19300, partial [Limnohabitans sp.]|nr:hypothetical protein [Limnohabitans sp.]
MNSFESYYVNQAGNGIAAFTGVKYQKGHGFFGRLLSKAVIPFLKFLGKNALSATANVASDIADSENFSFDNIKDTSKRRLKEQASKMVKKAASKILNGEGVKRKYKRRRRKRNLNKKPTFKKFKKVKKNKRR